MLEELRALFKWEVTLILGFEMTNRSAINYLINRSPTASFGVVDVLAWSMFWCCQWFGAVNVMALSMLWPGQYFRTVNVLVQSHKFRRATIPEGPQISTSPVH